MAVLNRGELERSPLADLHALASELGIEGYRRLRKDDLVVAILGDGEGTGEGGDGGDAGERGGRGARAAERDGNGPSAEGARRRSRRGRRGRSRDADPAREASSAEAVAELDEAAPRAKRESEPEPEPEPDPEEIRSGVLDIVAGGSALLRIDPFAQSPDDVWVSPAQIRRCELRAGDEVSGPVRPPRRSERHASLVRVDTVNGQPADSPAERPEFDALTPIWPTDRLDAPEGLDTVPFGRGSRVAIAGPPAAGATTLLARIASTLKEKHPEIELVVVLAGVRPEEVTDWRRAEIAPLAGGGPEKSLEEHAQAADMAAERGKRAVERGHDFALLVDGLDALAPAVARRVFGAARNAEGAGSLTVFATTGVAGEPQRYATTRILLESAGVVAAGSSTLRPELLTGK